ncbi:MAG: hypothetical protein JNM21_09690 [Taibaiella sp.]|nr:hypothetical protein [Taibaiella sp.]
MKYIRQTLAYFGVGSFQFDSILWQKWPQSRVTFLKDILSENIGVGMNPRQVCATFGFDKKEYLRGVWSYPIPNLAGKYKRTLNFYFGNDNVVNSIKIKYKLSRTD